MPSGSWAMPAEPNEADAILVLGGDGTVHRHLPQLVRLRLPVLVVPHGSGNDFARALQLRSVDDALSAWRQFVSGRGSVRLVDLGRYSACRFAGRGRGARAARAWSWTLLWLRWRGRA